MKPHRQTTNFEQRIEIRDLCTEALLRIHARVKRPGTVVLPLAERVFTPSRETLFIFSQARAIGPQAGRLCEMQFTIEAGSASASSGASSTWRSATRTGSSTQPVAPPWSKGFTATATLGR